LPLIPSALDGPTRRRRMDGRIPPAERSDATSAPSMSILGGVWAALVGVRPVRRAPGSGSAALRRSSGPFERSTGVNAQRTASTPPYAVCVALGIQHGITGGGTWGTGQPSLFHARNRPESGDLLNRLPIITLTEPRAATGKRPSRISRSDRLISERTLVKRRKHQCFPQKSEPDYVERP
jgi:hypothetical protein